MKKIFFLLLIINLLACTDAETSNSNTSAQTDENKKFEVKATITNLPDGSAYLEQIIGQNLIPKDTVEVKNGAFSFSGSVDEIDFYRVRLPNNTQFVFVLSNDQITITGDANDLNGSLSFVNSKESELFFEINRNNQEMQKVAQTLTAEYQKAQIDNDMVKKKEIEAKFEKSQVEAGEKINQIIKENPNSIVSAFYTLSFINPETNYDFFVEMTNKFKETLPNHKFTKELIKKAETIRAVSMGQMAPDIELQNPDGELVKLSSLRGKYVLIDFWASWCRPCRMENPNVVKVYNQYKDKNFEIFGVSLDNSKQKWIDAIQKDGITWLQVSDLAGWNSVAAAAYQVTSIPATFLIDKEGKIIAKNLRGDQLEKKLEEVLN